MDKGLEITKIIDYRGKETEQPVESREAVFHLALDQLLEQIYAAKSKDAAGGNILFRVKRTPLDDEGKEGKPETFIFRLMIQQMDGQDECSFCNGTGIEGS